MDLSVDNSLVKYIQRSVLRASAQIKPKLTKICTTKLYTVPMLVEGADRVNKHEMRGYARLCKQLNQECLGNAGKNANGKEQNGRPMFTA